MFTDKDKLYGLEFITKDGIHYNHQSLAITVEINKQTSVSPFKIVTYNGMPVSILSYEQLEDLIYDVS